MVYVGLGPSPCPSVVTEEGGVVCCVVGGRAGTVFISIRYYHFVDYNASATRLPLKDPFAESRRGSTYVLVVPSHTEIQVKYVSPGERNRRSHKCGGRKSPAVSSFLMFFVGKSVSFCLQPKRMFVAHKWPREVTFCRDLEGEAGDRD